MRRTLFACASLLSLVPSSLALPLVRGLEGYSRRVWQTQDGLPEETVQALAQTQDRYLWIGTSGGLVRFDGEQFVVFDRESARAFHENSVFCLTVAKDGSLWIGTDGGGVVRYRNREFRSYFTAEGLTNGFVRAIYQDGKGVVWVGTDNGLFRLQGDAMVRVDGRDGVPGIAVHAIVEDGRGRLWVGGSTLLMLYEGSAVEYRFQGELSANRIKTLFETRQGTLWAGTVSGLKRIERNALDEPVGSAAVQGIDRTIRVLREDDEGSLWIGTIDHGIFRYRNGRLTRLTEPGDLPSNSVLSWLEDAERNMWIGTQTGMLCLSKTALSMVALPGSADSDMRTVYQDRDGSVWVASTNVFRFDGKAAIPYHFPGLPDSIHIRNVLRDRSGAMWVGTDGHGLFRIAGKRVEHYTTEQGLINNFIRVMLEARDGSLWIGTDEGLSHRVPGGFKNYNVAEGLSYFSTRALLEDRQGDLWIGTDRGVSRMHAGSFLRDAVIDRLRGEKVWAIHEDQQGGLWLGTRGGGLYRWKQGKLSVFSTREGLASNSIYHILEDRNGTFWMSGPNGISSVSRADLDRLADEPSYRPAVTLYGVSDGMATTQMHGGTQPAGCLTSRGEVWFPSNKGPVRILTERAVANNWPPPAVVERVVAEGREVPLTDRLVLPPGNGKLEIHYGAIRLRSQERVRFKYRLDNFDSDWTEPLERHVAYYTNLPPGEYRFRVKAFEMNAPEQASEASVGIEWRPYFYRTAWFITLSSVLLMAAAWGAYKSYLRQIHARYEGILEERSRVAREMHDTLIQGCGGVSALLEACSTLGDSKPDTSKELLDCARAQIRATIDETRRAVWNLRQIPVTTGGIGSMLFEIAQHASLESRIPVQCEIEGKPRALDPDVERDLVMVAREAIHNAVHHAQPQNVHLRLRFERRRMSMVVTDDGRGFDPVGVASFARDHYGLVGMRERVEGLGGRFRVKSSPGKGTQIEVVVPVRKTAETTSKEPASGTA